MLKKSKAVHSSDLSPYLPLDSIRKINAVLSKLTDEGVKPSERAKVRHKVLCHIKENRLQDYFTSKFDDLFVDKSMECTDCLRNKHIVNIKLTAYCSYKDDLRFFDLARCCFYSGLSYTPFSERLRKIGTISFSRRYSLEQIKEQVLTLIDRKRITIPVPLYKRLCELSIEFAFKTYEETKQSYLHTPTTAELVAAGVKVGNDKEANLSNAKLREMGVRGPRIIPTPMGGGPKSRKRR